MKKHLFTITTLMSLIASPSIGFSEDDSASNIKSLIKALENKSENKDVRSGAAWALERMGPKALSALIKTQKDETKKVDSSSCHRGLEEVAKKREQK